MVAESKNENDCSQNEVSISGKDSALSISVSAGIDFKNINFVNTGSGSAARIAGTKNGFYSCQFLSPNGGALVANQGIAIIANSFMKASDTTVEGTATFYIFNTPIMLLGESVRVIYAQGKTRDGILLNSTTIIDRCSISLGLSQPQIQSRKLKFLPVLRLGRQKQLPPRLPWMDLPKLPPIL